MEQEIVHLALDNLRQAVGIEAIWHQNGQMDGGLDIILNGKKYTFAVEVRREVRAHQLPQIESLYHRQKNFLLLAHRLFPIIKEELRRKEIPYLEANGNFFMKKGDILQFVETQKVIDIEKNKGNRAYTKTGLKVLFYLLQHKEAIHYTQRELAEAADVGLGNIPQVIEGLRETGYLMTLRNKTYVWENKTSLLERWIAEYATVLRPKLKKERYTFKGKWQDILFDTKKTLWGGEPAADILTHHLRPEKLLIYTRESRMDMIKKYRLIFPRI